MSGGMTELRDSGVMIQLAHQAMLKMGLDVDAVFARLGVTPELLADRNIRTPHEAQLIFWHVLEEVSQDADILANICLYIRGRCFSTCFCPVRPLVRG